MEQADFIHLVRESEIESASNSAAYRRSVVRFAILGYLWVVGCLVLGLGATAFVVLQAVQGKFRPAHVWLLVFALGLLWASLKALWSGPEPEPDGIRITEAEAPELFKALERIRRKVQGPPIHAVYLQDEFNAAIRQRPRFGMLGGATNHLMIGLPLLMALDKVRVMAVLAHEYGHLRENHNRLSAWIYRSRRAWIKLYEHTKEDTGAMGMATRSFLNWYFPRFAAKSFAMARQDEYEADRIAAQLLGPEVAAATLTEVEIKALWLAEEFWSLHWRSAVANPLPQGPFRSMQALLRLQPEPQFAQDALRRSLAVISDVVDTHPALRDRVEAISGERPGLPSWSTKGAVSLLGPKAEQWMQHFDALWCKANASTWKQHHARMSRWQAHAQRLRANAANNKAADICELALIERRIAPHAPIRHLYEQVLATNPQHPRALAGLAGLLSLNEAALSQKCLETLWQTAPSYRPFAAEQMLQLLDAQAKQSSYDAAAMRLWRERAKQAEQEQHRFLQALQEAPVFQQVRMHDLSEFELEELRGELALYKVISQAWLLSKYESSMPELRIHLLLVQAPTLNEDGRAQLRRALYDDLNLPGMLLVVCVGPNEPASEEDARRHARQPIYLAAYRP